jgi:hypothetical protein
MGGETRERDTQEGLCVCVIFLVQRERERGVE